LGRLPTRLYVRTGRRSGSRDGQFKTSQWGQFRASFSVEVEVHLGDELGLELADLQLDDDEPPQRVVVEEEIDVMPTSA
jgi:hypothetical protein